MRVLVSLVCICILLAFVHAAQSIVTPLLLALTLSIAFQPVAERITRRGWPPVVNALLVTMGVLLMVAVAGALLYLAADQLAGSQEAYAARIKSMQEDLGTWLTDHGMRSSGRTVRRFDVAQPIENMVQSTVMAAGSMVSTLFLVLLITAFIQIEASVYRRKLIRALGGPKPVRSIADGLRDVQRYLAVKLVISLANGVFLGLWCWVWGVDSPLLWGVLAFALNFIPIIGSIIAAIPPILFGLLTGGWPMAAGVAAGYLLVNLVVDNIIEPRIMGQKLGLSPLVILVAMLIWGFVLGPVGALLSVPLTMTAKIMFEHDRDLRRVAMLMSNSSDLAGPGPAKKAA